MKKFLMVLFLIGAIAAVWDCINPLTPDPDLLPVNVSVKGVVVHSQVVSSPSQACPLPIEIAYCDRRSSDVTSGNDECFALADKISAFHVLRI